MLTGVVVAAGWGALIALMLTMAPDAQVKGMLFWLIGDLGGTTLATPALIVLAVALFGSLAFARDLNVLARGEEVAAALGVAVARTTFAALRARSARDRGRGHDRRKRRVRRARRAACAAARHRQRPARAVAGLRVAGGTLLVLADTLARTIVAPVQLPVGVITALVGVPVFLALLSRGRS